MKTELTLSIVIPVYNEERYLKRCLEAIKVQTVKPLEVLVVDNNSTDQSLKLAGQYKFVKIIKEPRQSVLYARNKGFNLAKGDIIGRIDADTVLPHNWAETVLKDFNDQSIAAVTGPVSYYDMPLPWFNYWLDHWIRKGMVVFMPNHPFLFGSNMAIRKDIWKKILPKICDDQQLHEDLDLAVHLHQNNFKISYDKRLHAGASSRRYEDSWQDFLHYGQMFRSSYLKHGIGGIAPRIVTTYYTLGYLLLRPTRARYNPITGLRTLKYAKSHSREAARKNPMAH